MSTGDEMERELRRLFADAAPRREPSALFDAVMTGTTTVPQRGRLRLRLVDPDAAILGGGRRRVVLLAAVAALVLALAAILAGSVGRPSIAPVTGPLGVAP